MENKIKPYSEWPWWVKFFLLPFGSKILKGGGNIYHLMFIWIGGWLIFFGDYTNKELHAKITFPLYLFNLAIYVAMQSYAVNWILKYSSPDELKHGKIGEKVTFGIIQVVFMAGLPYLHALISFKI